MDTLQKISVDIMAAELLLPPSDSVGLSNRVHFALNSVTEDIVRDPTGLETIVARYPNSPTRLFTLELCCYDPEHIYDLLCVHLSNPPACEHLAVMVSVRATQMGFGLRSTFMSVNATLIQERIFLTVPDPSPARGVSVALLQRLSQEGTVDVKGLKDLGSKSETCSICLEDFSGADKDLTLMPCSHVFHRDCVFEWLRKKNSCPMCRRVLYDD